MAKDKEKIKRVFFYEKGLPLGLIKKIEEHKDCLIIASIGNGVIMAKRLDLSVHRVNNSSVFMPREHVEDNTYWVMAILEYKPADKHCYDSSKLKKAGIPVFRVDNEKDIDKAIEKLR